MKTEHLKQLREAFNNATRGLWCNVTHNGKWSLTCNGEVVADGMNMNDSYLVDVMHYHFTHLIDKVEELSKENDRLKQNEDELNLSLATSQNEAAYWHSLYNTSVKATEKIVEELTSNE